MKIFNEIITSRTNPTVKWASSLAEKKGRNESRCFIAEGVKLTLEALDCGLPVSHIFVAESKKKLFLGQISRFLKDDRYNDCQLYVLGDNAFEKISTEKSPQGIISVVKYLDNLKYIDIIYKEEFFLHDDECALALHSVRDPSNLGAVIRSAAAFGADHIILSNDCAEIFNPKTVRSAMGSLFKVKISIVSDFMELIGALREKGRKVYSAELNENALSLDSVKLSRNDVVIIGNEGHGIPLEVSDKCDSAIYIPISSKIESLNASVAAAIFMWEQRK